jgi:hypothetical protein
MADYVKGAGMKKAERLSNGNLSAEKNSFL